MRADENTTSLFFSLPLTLKKDHIFISAQNIFSKYNTISAEKLWSIPLSVNIKPVITTENIFLFTKNNLLVCLDSVSGDIIWSRNIFKQSNAEKGVNIKEADKFKLMGPIAAIKALNQSNREKLKIKETKLKNENKKVKKSFWKNPIAAISRSNREKLELGTDVGEGIFKEPIILDERYGAINNLYMAANKLFLFTAGGNLMTFNPNTGKLSFNTKIANSIAADSPMFVNGKLYFFDNSSRFYQYE
jgi:outer membrane protein assembly factor BamB